MKIQFTHPIASSSSFLFPQILTSSILILIRLSFRLLSTVVCHKISGDAASLCCLPLIALSTLASGDISFGFHITRSTEFLCHASRERHIQDTISEIFATVRSQNIPHLRMNRKRDYDTAEGMTERIEELFLVPRALYPRILGKAGSRIQEMERTASCRITDKNVEDPGGADKNVRLSGTSTAVLHAKVLVLKALQECADDLPEEPLDVEVPQERVRLVVGKRGSNIQEIEQVSGTRITDKFSRNDSTEPGSKHVFAVKGNRFSVRIAHLLITGTADDHTHETHAVQSMVLHGGGGGGSGGGGGHLGMSFTPNFRQQQQQQQQPSDHHFMQQQPYQPQQFQPQHSQEQIQKHERQDDTMNQLADTLPPEDPFFAPKSGPPPAQDPFKAMQDPFAMQASSAQHFGSSNVGGPVQPTFGRGGREAGLLRIPRSCYRALVGQKGKTIQDLEQRSGTKISDKDIPDDGGEEKFLHVYGDNPEQVLSGQVLVLKTMRDELVGPEHLGECNTVFTIPSSQVRLIVGKGGSTIRELESSSTARISDKNEGSMDPSIKMFRITGDKFSVQLAELLMNSRLQQAAK
ncbi:hypothetical protein CYMTET_50406 [Cymbomonas tetramitiformis]|uniref:K Homology domain-containing protein n=1 Tax=Cymbomonas tetramitiformis TaxID=36881 RepID=A0AAE0BQ55_9CHLO|nr:hypothetical protein CYMTET_50406 [Cymbomonas tetramitiformis]